MHKGAPLISTVLSLVMISFCTFGQQLTYPETPKGNDADTIWNKIIPDEYRWLEDISSENCKAWVEKENELTKKELKTISFKCNAYVAIDKYSYVEYDNPVKEGDYYFFYAFYDYVSAPSLFVQNTLNGPARILVDLNDISARDDISLKDFAVSKDSRHLAYQFARNGSDWAEIKVVNIKSGGHQPDHLKNVKFSSIAWRGDGFYYSRFPENGLGKTRGQELYYHRLNTAQSEDQLVFRRKDNPDIFFHAFTTSDERFLIVQENDNKKDVINYFYIDFLSQELALRPLITKLPSRYHVSILDNQGDVLIALSRKDADNGMIVKISPENPMEWKVLIPEFGSALLLNTILSENKIIAVYQSNRRQQIIFFDYQGKVLHAIQLPFGFSASGFSGEKTDKKLLFSYQGYTQPKIVYILDIETFEMKPLDETVVTYDFTQFVTEELEYESFDGTMVPLFLVHKKDLVLPSVHPVLLSAYGGFGVIDEPGFDPGIVHFCKEGGIYAFANIRGGGDKGRDWAMQGRGKYKPNSFKDFISAAEFLIARGYTTPDRLAITGGSNGGLVVGVAMTQRPELFKAAVPVVAPFDMLRFEKFTIGHLHSDEYGSLADSAAFVNLYNFSPLNNIREDVNYPATLIMTSEFDDRVPPLHSYKFAAKLQNRIAQQNPVFLRVEKKAGHHGATGSIKDIMKEKADMYNFILYHLN